MSLVTTCPACGTAFHVKPEHLAAHRGDVCCGKCAHYFNALEHLAEVVQASDEPKIIEPAVAEDTLHEATETAITIESTPELSVSRAEAFQQAEVSPEPDKVVAPIPEFYPTVPSHSLTKPVSPWLLVLFALLLLASALLQTVYFLRTDIATLLPQAKPYLIKACEVYGCTVELPRKVHLLSIDDSDLQEDTGHKDVLVFTSTLVNRAEFPQAYPLLELTLTDIDDHPVLRRILTPQEYLGKSFILEDGLQAGAEFHIKLFFTTKDVEATGYRIYIKYP